MKHFLKHPFKALKTYLPKSMFGRSLLILVAPLVLVETISAYVFFDNHWDHVTKTLANNIAGEVATVVALHNNAPSERTFYKSLAGNHLKFVTTHSTDERIEESKSKSIKDDVLDTALKKNVFTPYQFEITPKNIIIKTAVNDGVLTLITPRKRLFSKSFSLFIMWVAATSAFFLCIAVAFMHNQVKPLRRLAIAADRFGKGRSFPDFKPEGSREIRKVSKAFLDMKARLQRQLTQRMEMLSGVSHDLRTPLTRMRLQLAMMPDDGATEGLQKDVDEMNKMLEGYLTFVRGEGGEDISEINLNDLIHDAIQGRALPDTVVHYSPHPLPLASVKYQALKRCLTNLINNACRYGKEVWVSATQDKDYITICIEDDGPGISEEKIKDVFKPFFRIETSRNVTTGGVGLGLTIARDIAHHHGGEITLSSSPDHGGLKASLSLPY